MSGSYRLINGNAVNPKPLNPTKEIVIPHVCNNERKWGSGFVLAVSDRWPKAKKVYLESPKLNLGRIQTVKVEDGLTIVNMIAQTLHKTPKDRIPLSYFSLITCMELVAQDFSHLREESELPEIHCPKFGSCRAGGDWEVIEDLIKELWVDIGYDVTAYEYHEE